MNQRKTAALFLLAVALGSVLTILPRLQIKEVTDDMAGAGSLACTFIISTNGSRTSVKDCASGVAAFSGVDAATEINDAIAALRNGGVIHLRAGNYTLSTPILGAVNNVTFEGEGIRTVFNANVGFRNSLILVRGSNWVLRDFKIDGSNQPRKHSYEGIYLTGNNETIMDTYVTGTDHAAIDGTHFGCGGNCGYGVRILNNTITNGFDDGIIVRGSDVTVEGNTVDTTHNHNGISLVSPQFVSVDGNSINNTDNGIALENLGYGQGPAEFISITANTIRNSRFFGFWIYSADGDSGDHVTFNRNTIINPRTGGIEVDSGSHNLVSDNIVANSSGRGIYVLGLAQFLTISGNTVIAPKQNGIWLTTDFNDGLVQNNTITAPTGSGILLVANSNVAIRRNIISYPTATSPIAGIEVDRGNDIIIDSNLVRLVGNNHIGVTLIAVTGFAVVGNNITCSGMHGAFSPLTAGIRVSNSTNGSISSNTVLGNASSCIVLENVSNTTVVGSRVAAPANCTSDAAVRSTNVIGNNNLNNCGLLNTISERIIPPRHGHLRGGYATPAALNLKLEYLTVANDSAESSLQWLR